MIEPQVPTNKPTGQAASLTARLSGLPMVPRGWNVEEVERLLFVRELVRTGRMGS